MHGIVFILGQHFSPLNILADICTSLILILSTFRGFSSRMTRLASLPTSRDPTLVSIPRISAADSVTPVMRDGALVV